MREYTIILRPIEDGWWFAECVDVEGAFSQGATIEEARENVKEAIQLMLETGREEAAREAETTDALLDVVEV